MKKFLLTLFAMFASMVSAGAYDFTVDGIYYDINEDGTTLAIVPDESYKDFTGDLVLPDTVTYNGTKYTVKFINNEAFKYCNGLTSVTLPNTVTVVGMMAFDHCDSLETLTIGTSLYMSGSGAFTNCKNVKTVNWNARKIHSFSSYLASPLLGYSNVTTFNVGPDVEEIPEALLYSFFSLNTINWNARNCANSPFATLRDDIKALVKTVNIGDSVRSLPPSFIKGLKNVENLTIGKSVTTIGPEAFNGCVKITTAIFNDNLRSVGAFAFHYCTSLNKVELGNNVEFLGQYAFGSCIKLGSIHLPETITEISDGLFSNCQYLANVNIPRSITRIGARAFNWCPISSFDLPATVTEIGDAAFASTPITSMSIPPAVTKIGSWTFSHCGMLKTIDIHNRVTDIGNSVFYNCESLTHVTLPPAVKVIGETAFIRCYGLESVSLPESLDSIGPLAFSRCHSLKKIYCYAQTPPMISDGTGYVDDYDFPNAYPWRDGSCASFAGNDLQHCTVYVPRGTGDSYRSDFCWSQFNIVEADMSGVDEINCVKPADGPAQRYNVLGQPVGDDYHGIVIGNGKKILVP